VNHLGRSLAYIQIEAGSAGAGMVRDSGDPADGLIEEVRARLQGLNASGANASSGIAVPARACLVERAFLDGNIDFFLLYLGISKAAGTGCIDCVKLMKHLNDCYRCFDAYCGTLQEYYLERERLSRGRRT
jgi:hypothetical protein